MNKKDSESGNKKLERQIVVACVTLKDELAAAMETCHSSLTVRWLPVKHDTPDEMRKMIQHTIDSQTQADTILLAYGCCGGGLVGIKSDNARLVIPRAADCIALLLNNQPDLERLRTRGYFLTRGWLNGEKSLEKSLDAVARQYGPKKMEDWIRAVYGGYQALFLIDTGAYAFAQEKHRVGQLARRLGLKPRGIAGDISLLKRLVSGQWDSRFIIKKPGTQTTYDDFS